MNVLKFAAAIPLVLAFSIPAMSQTAQESSSFEVRLEIEPGCEIKAENIDFGKVGIISKTLEAKGQLSIACTPGLTYDIRMNSGSHPNGSTTARLMTLAGGTDTVAYQLYTNEAANELWGSDAGANTVNDTGTGETKIYPFAARVPQPATTPNVGVYTDQVTATLFY